MPRFITVPAIIWGLLISVYPLFSSQLIKVVLQDPGDLQRLQALGLDLAYFDPEGMIDVIISNEEEINRLRSLGLTHWIAVDNLENFLSQRLLPARDDMGGYKTFREIVQELDQLHQEFSDIISEPFSIGESVEGRPLWMVKVSDNPEDDEDEPQVLFTALIHSREVITAEVLLQTIRLLGELYGEDEAITRLIDEREMFFLPCHNPDGYVYNEQTNPQGGGMWRKNRRDNGDGTFGVDLNRNFSYRWGYDNIGSSPNSIDETYRGENPFSEPETQAIRDFVNERNITISLYFHSYSNLCLYPPGYDYYQPSHLEVYKALSRRFTSHNGYISGTPWETIYQVNGSSDDWLFYGEEHDPVFAFTIEVGNQDDFFWPPLNRIAPLVRENIPTCLAAAEFADNPRRALPPHPITDLNARRFGERWVRVSWRSPNDQDNPPQFYKIKILSNPTREWAGFEEDDREWQAVNFFRTSAQAHQGQFSFALRPSANLATLTYPKESPLPDTIRAWMMWNLRADLKHGMALEVSTDGLTWHPLSGTHTQNLIVNEIDLGPVVSGNSNNTWRLISWATGEWGGRMGQIRFRYYRFGTSRMIEHCYIDQVGPFTAWEWETLIADSVSDPPFIDTLREENTWYSVQVVDSEEDLSFWSLPVPIEEPLPSIHWDLGVGWNLIGIPLNLSPPDGWDVLTPLWERGLLFAVKDPWGRFQIPRWQFSNLEEFDPLKSLYLYMTDSTRWELEGERVAPQTPVPLRAGWNGIAYLPSQPLTPQEALRSVQENLIFVRDGEGRFWWVEEEFDNLGELVPGKGYLLKLRNADTLIFPIPEGLFATNLSSSSANYSLPPGVIPTSPDPYLILLHWETSPPQGVVWAKDINNDIVGGAWVRSGDRQTGVAIWGKDPLGKKGLSPHEHFSLTFQLTNNPTQESVIVQPFGQEFSLSVFPPQALFFTPDSFARVASSLNVSEPFITLNIYPNPFNDIARIEVRLPAYTNAQAEIWDLRGRRVLSRFISQGPHSGFHSFYWDATSIPSGVYLLQMDISSSSGVRQHLREKLLLLR